MSYSVKDLLNGKVQTKGQLHKTDSVKELEFVWKRTFAEVCGVGLVHLTVKQLGQLKQFAKHCPEGKAAQVLEHVLRNWTEFVKDAKTKAGAFPLPTHPNIDFLLKHAWIAVHSASESPKPSAPVKQEASPGVQTAQPVQLVSQKKDDPLPTLEELLAIINED